MLAGESALELTHQVAGLFRDCSHLQGAIGLHVQHRTHVQATHRCVCVPGASCAVLLEYLGKPVGVFGQMLQRYGTVFDEGHGFAIAAHGHHDIQTRLAHFPDIALQCAVQDLYNGSRQLQIAHQLAELSELAHLCILILTRELHQQDRVGLSLEELVHDRPEGRVAARQIDHGPIHQLHGIRIQLDDMLRTVHRLPEGWEVAHT